MIPKATNSLNPQGIFFQRKVYEDVYPSVDFPVPFDLWQDRFLYGKATNKGNALLLSESNLKKLSVGDNIFVLNFVADAFEAFRRLFNLSKIKNTVVVEDSNLINLEPVRGWQNVSDTFNDYMNMLFQVFNEVYIEQEGISDTITNFDSFLKVFFRFSESIINQYPVSLSCFIKSKYNSPMSSGLMIELSLDNHAEDQDKYRNFINDPNFALYASLAQRHGFAIDKHAPWRLVFDLKSEASEPYLKKYDLTVDKVFTEAYHQNHFLDFETLRVYIVQFYNSLVIARPFIENKKVSGQNSFLERIERKQVSFETLKDIYNDDFWIRLYGFLRFKEEQLKLTQTEFDSHLKRTIQLYKQNQDLEKTLKFLNGKILQLKKVQGRSTSSFDLSERRLTGEVRQFQF